MNDDFYENIDKLKKQYKLYPKAVAMFTREAATKAENLDSPNKKLTPDVINMIVFILSCIVIVLFGLINIKTIGLQVCGMIFLLAGFFIGLKLPGFGTIFLFSHGLSGFCIMTVPILVDLLNDPIVTENPITFYYIIGVLAACTLALFIAIIILSFTNKESGVGKKEIILIWCFGIISLIVQILPHVADKIVTFVLK